MIEFEILAEPYGKGRPRFTRGGHAYTPEKTRAYEKLVQDEYIRQTGGGMYEGPMEVFIKATCRVPKSGTKKDRERKLQGFILPTKKPDCDNIAKTILDALNGIAYKDDSQIVSLHVYKVYGEAGKVEVILRRMKVDE
jgi:Holliday junction resolvase RusA-like endonuclease